MFHCQFNTLMLIFHLFHEKRLAFLNIVLFICLVFSFVHSIRQCVVILMEAAGLTSHGNSNNKYAQLLQGNWWQLFNSQKAMRAFLCFVCPTFWFLNCFHEAVKITGKTDIQSNVPVRKRYWKIMDWLGEVKRLLKAVISRKFDSDSDWDEMRIWQ